MVGFVAKAAVGASATKALKSTKTFQRVTDYVGSSRVGTVYTAVKSPVDAGKARVAAKIADGADRASPGVLRHARSAGATYRLWRLQRRVDACDGGLSVATADCGDPFEDLSEEETEELAELLARDGAGSADVLDDFSGVEKQRLADFLKDTGRDGDDLLAQMEADDIKTLLSFNRGRAGDMRKQLVRLHSRGEISGEQVSAFSRDLKKLESVSGLADGPIKDIATAGDPGNVKGAMYEVKAAARYGGDDVEGMSITYGPKGVDGEIDIKLKNGDFVEAKNKELTYNEFTDMKGKIDALEKHEQLDGHTITVVGRETPSPDTSLYQKFTDDLEKYAQQKHGIDIEVKIKEEGDY